MKEPTRSKNIYIPFGLSCIGSLLDLIKITRGAIEFASSTDMSSHDPYPHHSALSEFTRVNSIGKIRIAYIMALL